MGHAHPIGAKRKLHIDFDPEFQNSVLPSLREQIDRRNAKASHYGCLVDRVRINTNRPQVYGTQLDYNDKGQAFPKNLEDSENVKKRRAELEMEALGIYLNVLTKVHFEMNRTHLEEQGITIPNLYEVPTKR